MSPRDLADDLGQLVTTLTSLQHAKSGTDPHFGNIDLPFFKGSLSDAIQLNEALKKFLADNTVSSAVDAAKAGDPTFVSLQELLDRLDTATGLPGGVDLQIPAPSIGFDSATHKLHFTIGITKTAPGSAVDLNAAAAAVSGGTGSTYTDTTLTDNSKDWTGQNFAGRHVVAGLAGATVASNTAHTLTLQVPAGGTVAWTPATPAAGSAYSISGAEGDVGIPQLGNALQSAGHGILNANAVNATAKVKPSYSASIALVLDLTPPTFHDPPLVQDNGDGTTTLVSSTPTAANRLLVDTDASSPLLSADFPIDGNIDIFANAGFLQVELKGSAHVCQSELANCSLTPSASQHMLKIAFKPHGLLNFGQIVHDLLTDPAGLLDFQVKVRGEGAIDVTVPGTNDFFHGASAHAGFHWNDLTKTTGTDGPQFDVSDLSELANFDFDPSNPKALFSIILKTLQTLNKTLGDGDPSSTEAAVFNTKIPVIGRSLHDLLKSDESGLGPNVIYSANKVTDSSRSAANGNAFPQSLVGRSIVAGTQVGIVASVSDNELTVSPAWTNQPSNGTPYTLRSELDDVISILQSNPSDNLQSLITAVNNRLGHTSPISFEYRDDATVGGPGHPALVIKLDWQRAFHTSAPLKLDFGGPSAIAGVQGSGQVSLGASGEIKIGLVVPLEAGTGPDDADHLKILDDSSIGVKLDASVDNATLATTIGPLSISLGDPTSSDKATAKASYSLDLAQSGATGNAETFSDFFGSGGVGATLNASSNGVDCGLPDHSTPLSLCANLPLYFSTDGGTSYTQLITPSAGHPNSFALRLPKTGSDLADHFDLFGAQIDGHDRLEAPDPGDLAAALESHFIDFTRLDGLDSFLNLIEQSLNTASFGGKLPLIGDDLQQGADFIGKIRDAVHSALGQLPNDGNLGDMAGVRDWVNNKLGQALDTAGVNPDLAKLDTLCSDSLGEVPTPTVAPHAGATDNGKTYKYVVAAYITVDGVKHQSKPSPAGQTDHGPTALGGANKIDVTWTTVTGAAGYKVFRDEGGVFKEVADQTSASFTDDGTATPGDAPEDPATDPVLHDCSYDKLDSVVVVFDLSQGDFSGDTLNCDSLPAGHECIDKTVPLNIGIPGLSLKASQLGEGPHVQLGYRLHLAFGISRSEGFFVDTKNGDPQPELAFGLNFTLPSQIEAQLAFINITAQNCDDTMTADCITSGPDKAPAPGAIAPLFGGTFKIDMKSPNSNGHLTISDLGAANLDDLFDLKLHAGVNIDWLLKAKVGDDAGFPGIQTEFRMSWAWDNVKPGEDSGSGVTPLAISFKRVQIDAGDVFGQVIGPIIKEIKKVTGPLDPIIKTLYAPIPVLSDLSHLVGGDDVTLVSIAKAFSTLLGGPDLTFVDTIVAVIKVINEIPDGSNHVLIPIGSFDVAGGSALDNTATPDNTDSLISAKNVDAGAADGDGVLGNLDDNDSGGSGGGHKIMKGSGNPADSDTAKAGFEFPVFQHPATLFNLIMGGDVTLVTFDSGPLTLGFDWRQEFGPVYAPPPVLITLHGSASVTLRIKAGFDTYGIRKAFEKVRNGEAFDISVFGDAILQSLFFATVDNDGKPLPVVTFRGEIAAGAEVSAVIITVGIEGGVGLEISFLWNDPNNDGKFRISEFLQAALNNPICLFVVSGRVYVFLKLFVKIGFGPFSVSFDFTIVNVTLLDFSVKPDCTPPPPKLGGLSNDGHTLIIYAAALGHASQRGHSSYESNDEEKDTVKITSLHDYTNPANPTFKGVGVEMLGIRREFINANIDRVVVFGGGATPYAKPMTVTFLGDGKSDEKASVTKDPNTPPPPTASFEKDAIVFGGSGDDNIKTGIGNSYVDGGGGKDVIVTADRTVLNKAKTDYVRSDAKAWVAGGAGDDSITVGNGNDRVAGDGTLGGGGLVSVGVKELGSVESGNPAVAGPTLSVPDWNSLPEPNSSESNGTPNGIDKISLGLGSNKGYGNGGDDTLSVAADNSLAKVHPELASILTSQGNTLVGGTGSDNIAGWYRERHHLHRGANDVRRRRGRSGRRRQDERRRHRYRKRHGVRQYRYRPRDRSLTAAALAGPNRRHPGW
jgi:hypothetical protein